MRSFIFLLILVSIFHFGFSAKNYQLPSFYESYESYLAKPIAEDYEKLSLFQFYNSLFGVEFKAMPPLYNFEYERFTKILSYYCENTYKSWNKFRVDYLTKFFSVVSNEFVKCIDNVKTECSIQGNPDTFLKTHIKSTLESCNIITETETSTRERSKEEDDRVVKYNKQMLNSLSTTVYNNYISCLSDFHKNIAHFKDDSFKGDLSSSDKTMLYMQYPVMKLMKLALAENPSKNDLSNAIYNYLNIRIPTKSDMQMECKSHRSYASLDKIRYELIQGEYNNLATIPDTYQDFADLNNAIDEYYDLKPNEIYTELFKKPDVKSTLIKLQEVPQKEKHLDYRTYIKYAKMNETKYMYMYGLFKKNLDPYGRRVPLGVQVWSRNDY